MAQLKWLFLRADFTTDLKSAKQNLDRWKSAWNQVESMISCVNEFLSVIGCPFLHSLTLFKHFNICELWENQSAEFSLRSQLKATGLY